MKILRFTAVSGNDHRGDTAIYVVDSNICSFHSPPGTELTVLKLNGQLEQVRETPEQILAMLGVIDLPRSSDTLPGVKEKP